MADVNDPVKKISEFDSGQPHEFWKHLRDVCPVSLAEEGGQGKRPVYYVSTWQHVQEVLADEDTFSSSINAEGTGRFMGPILLAMNGAQHHSRRLLIAQALRPAQIAKWEQTLLRPVIENLCGRIAANGRAELIETVICKYPVQVICGICGIPAEDSPKFFEWAKQMHRGMVHEEAGRMASEEMRAYLEPIVEHRKLHRGDDLISDIIHAEVDGNRLNDEEIYGFLRLLLPAGSESTFRQLGTALLAILRDPNLHERVKSNRSMLGAVVEESLRWDSANSMVSRIATRDTEVGGCPIPKGAALKVLTNSANRDEWQTPDADVFDMDRPGKTHLGFGYGPHFCLGQGLARMEIRVGLDVILSKLPGIRLDPDFPPPVIQGAAFRGPNALNVLFD